jgi:glycerol uptake facilitator-like aquaporin
LAGAAAGRALLPRAAWDSIGGTVTHPAVPALAAFGLEAGMTAVLVIVILSFSASERLARLTPLAIVPVLTAIIWLGSPWTGASINPARSEGPALAFGDFSDLWLYLAAPSAAGLAVGLAWRVTRTPLRALLRDT